MRKPVIYTRKRKCTWASRGNAHQPHDYVYLGQAFRCPGCDDAPDPRDALQKIVGNTWVMRTLFWLSLALIFLMISFATNSFACSCN